MPWLSRAWVLFRSNPRPRLMTYRALVAGTTVCVVMGPVDRLHGLDCHVVM